MTPESYFSPGAVMNYKYASIEKALEQADIRPTRLVKDNECFGLQVYGADMHDVKAVSNALAIFDEVFNIGISLDSNNNQITII